MKSAYFSRDITACLRCNRKFCLKFRLGPVKCPPSDLVKFLIKRMKELAQFGNDRGIHLWMNAPLATCQALVKYNIKSQTIKPSGGIEV